MKKILLVSTRHSIFGEPTRRAFSELGFEVRVVDYRGNMILMPGNLIHRMVDKLPNRTRRLIYDYFQDRVDKKILNIAREYDPDLIFVLKAKDIDVEILESLRKIAPTANWYSETMDHWDTISKIAFHYDYFFNFDPFLVDKLTGMGHKNAHYLPFCADISKKTEWSEPKKYEHNVIFIGSYHPTRYAEREYIFDQIKDLGLAIWGNKAWLGTSLVNYYKGYASASEMYKIYNSSKIVINFYLTDVLGVGVNLRPFEITASGSLLINHDIREDIFKLFEAGKEFISFHGRGDIREKVLFYLSHKDERKKIARSGFERTRNNHTYLDRMREVVKITRIQ